MRQHAKAIRPLIKHVPGAWVRQFSDGRTYAGARTRKNAEIVKSAIEAAGQYRCEMNGTPGTSEADVIDVFPIS